MGIDNCRIVSLPKVEDHRGKLTFVEGMNHIPFEIKRIYYLYSVPDISDRGEHAHKNLKQLIIAISGSFNVQLDDGFSIKNFILNNPQEGLLVDSMIWRKLNNFTDDAVCMVLASDYYDESDYFRNYNDFKNALVSS
ncbi:MAG: sugar 3,4-ketoisomerase [Gammaproteobacteria bacterium]